MTCRVTHYYNMISAADCDAIINEHGGDLAASTTLGQYIEGYRTAENKWIYDEHDNLINSFIYKVSELTKKPIENQEKPTLIKYEIGGEYKNHHDYFHPGTDYYDSCMAQGGQRTHSAILYLNDDFTGGETHFPTLDITVKPKKGSIVIWNNMDNGRIDPDSFHAGLPVIEGRKWILILWIRERKFQ